MNVCRNNINENLWRGVRRGSKKYCTKFGRIIRIIIAIFLLLSVNGACPSLVVCAVPTPVKTTRELSGPAFGVLPKTGDEELEDRGKHGWERLRMICARSTLAWRRQDGALWIDRYGVYSWIWLHSRNTLQREKVSERAVLVWSAH